MSLPDAAQSAAHWKHVADQRLAAIADMGERVEALIARAAETDSALHALEALAVDCAQRAADAEALAVRGEAALRDRATLEESYAIARANLVEVRQLLDVERDRAQRFFDLFGACLTWRDFRRSPNKMSRDASERALLREIEVVAADVPH